MISIIYVKFLILVWFVNGKKLDLDLIRNTALPLGPVVWKMKGGLIKNGIEYNEGVAFSVWAPNAKSAYVVSFGNNFRWINVTMNNDNGTWYTNIGNARIGDKYNYNFITPQGISLVRLDPRAQDIEYLVGNETWLYSVVHDPNFPWFDSYTPPPINEIVIYEMHIPSFNPGISTIGTFDSAIAKLPYLMSLGINMIELMPIGSPTGWGYNPCMPYAIDKQYGGYQALKRFVNAANNIYGIGVMVDIVWNHADPNNPLIAYDGYMGPSGNGIYFYEDGRAESPWGPRWNYDNPNVQSYILEHINILISEYHISGFRWDSTVCIRKGGDGQVCWESKDNIDSGWELMQQGNLETHQFAPNLFTTAEDSQNFRDITRPVNDSSAGIPGAKGGAGFDSQWGYPFYYQFQPILTYVDNRDVNMNTVADIISNNNGDGGDNNRVLFTENHDMASNQNKGRIPNQVNPGGSPYIPNYWAQKKSMLGVGVVLTTSLYPMLFQGQEMLTYASFDFPNPPSIDWNLPTVNLGIVSLVTDLISLRLNKNNNTIGLTGSKTKVLLVVNTATDKVSVMIRSLSNNTGIFNIPSDGIWKVRFNGDNKKYSSLYGGYGMSQKSIVVTNGVGSVMLPQYSMLILSQ